MAQTQKCSKNTIFKYCKFNIKSTSAAKEKPIGAAYSHAKCAQNGIGHSSGTLGQAGTSSNLQQLPISKNFHFRVATCLIGNGGRRGQRRGSRAQPRDAGKGRIWAWESQ